MLVGMTIQLVQKAWETLTTFCLLGTLRVMGQPYLWFNPAEIYFQILSQRLDGFVFLKREETLFEAGSPLQGPDEVDETAKN